ncbi:hypothetical protein GCM10009643_01760 [Microbacterium aurantiacum]
MTATRIRVDFNSRASGGLVRSSLRRAENPIREGDMVVAYQPGEDMEHFGKVVDVDPVTGRVAIAVDWESKPDATELKAVSAGSVKFVISQPLPYRVSRARSGAAFNSSPVRSPQLVSVS